MTTNAAVNKIKYKGEPCVKMTAGKYTCIIAPGIGSNILRLYDSQNSIELVNFHPRIPMKWLRYPSIVCGLPTMLFPNRLGNGILKTSDNEYHFPINEPKLNNYIHGFIHCRKYNLIDYFVDDNNCAVVITEYCYDKNDNFFNYFPLTFTVRIKFILNNAGLRYELTLTNNSDKMLPAGLGNHTSMKAPFKKRGKKQNLRIQIPVIKRCQLNDKCLCTGKLIDISEEDKKYLDGSMIPVLHDIDNHMFLIDKLTLEDGRQIHGIKISDTSSGKSIIYEVDDFYKFFLIWNCGGNAGFFCPEPISWMIDAPNINESSDITGYKELSPGESLTTWQHLSVPD